MATLLTADDASKTRKKDVAARLLAFLWDRDGLSDGKSFVVPEVKAADVRLHENERYLVRVEAIILRWVELKTAEAAKVYYFTGMGDRVPQWVADAEREMERADPARTAPLTGGRRFRDRMLKEMDRWTVTGTSNFNVIAGGRDLNGQLRVIRVGPMGETRVPEWVNAFLDDLAYRSDRVWQAHVTAPTEVEREIRDMQDTPLAPSDSRRLGPSEGRRPQGKVPSQQSSRPRPRP